MKAMTFVIGVVLGLTVGLGGGYALWNMGDDVTEPGAGLAQMDREQLKDMTEEERQAFFEEQGMEPPVGGMGVGGMRGGSGGGMIEGTVLAIDDESITLELADGGSQTIYLGDETTYAETSEAGVAGLAEGVTVRVAGTPQADGVVTADSVVVGE